MGTTTIQVARIIENRIEFLEIEPELEVFQALVGGYIERYPLRQSTHLYWDEDGRVKGLPENELANRVLIPLYSSTRNINGSVIHGIVWPGCCGPVLVVGSQEPEGQPDGADHSISRRTVGDMMLSWQGRPIPGGKG
jgi:hypothetical protein